jgi:SAM-dependent methyltransferase
VLEYLTELVRVLRPGGLLVFQLPGRISLLHQLQPRRRLYEVLRSIGVNERILLERLELSPMHMRFIPPGQVVRSLESFGAKVLRSDRHSDVDHTYFVTR